MATTYSSFASKCFLVLASSAIISLASGQDPCQVAGLTRQVWDCNNPGVASLNGKALSALIPSLFGSIRPLRADFSANPSIKRLEIHGNVPLEFKAVKGPSLETISIKGNGKMINDLCIFVQEFLPNLRKVAIEDAIILSFGYSQLEDCLLQRNGLVEPVVQLEIRDTKVKMDPTKSVGALTFDDNPLVKSVSMLNVTFEDLESPNQLVISKELQPKFMGQKLFFSSSKNQSNCGCDFGKKSDGSFACVTPSVCPDDNVEDVREPFGDDDVTTTTPLVTTAKMMPITNSTKSLANCKIASFTLSLVFAAAVVFSPAI